MLFNEINQIAHTVKVERAGAGLELTFIRDINVHLGLGYRELKDVAPTDLTTAFFLWHILLMV